MVNFVPDEEIILHPKEIPVGSVIKEYREFDVQDLIIEKRNIPAYPVKVQFAFL